MGEDACWAHTLADLLTACHDDLSSLSNETLTDLHEALGQAISAIAPELAKRKAEFAGATTQSSAVPNAMPRCLDGYGCRLQRHCTSGHTADAHKFFPSRSGAMALR